MIAWQLHQGARVLAEEGLQLGVQRSLADRPAQRIGKAGDRTWFPRRTDFQSVQVSRRTD